ncbi:SPASM domain-containing protein [Candidatus Sumerlaeota bacterium]|nr:SPASM domain-containing protein [Candidatus Sumerlaeota bacterium]
MTLNAQSLFPDILFEDHKPLPNLSISLNSSGREEESFDPVSPIASNPEHWRNLDPRHFLPLADKISLFHIRNVMLTGVNPAVYPFLKDALKCFSGKVENLSLVISPGQSLNVDLKLIPLLQEIVYLIPPYWLNGIRGEREEAESLEYEISHLRKNNRNIAVRAMLYLSARNLSRLGSVIDRVEKAGFDRLYFFPSNLFLLSEKGRVPKPAYPEHLPSEEEVMNLERTFWDFLEERFFESRLFDLNLCRRQLERVLEYFKAALGREEFSPPFCRASRIAIHVDPEGRVRACPYQKVIGDLAKKSLIRIRESEELFLFQANLNLARSPLCPACPGVYPHLLRRSR